ncbi:MAG: LPS export ABC transporter periplasmic protein LptC [Rubrivivax sp.]|jgi:lipopolysaccharide export system protein LptC
MSPRGIELNLPDLPEVPIALGRESPAPDARTTRQRRRRKPADLIASWLPLLLMAGLAVGSGWLVRNAPQAVVAQTPRAERVEPDYTMDRPVVQRFDAEGRLRLEIQGQAMRHYPQGGRVEVDRPVIRAYAPDGRITTGTAQRVLSDARATDVLLAGDAVVQGTTRAGLPAQIRGDALRLMPRSGQLRSDEAVEARIGPDQMQAAGLLYDDAEGRITLDGPMRVVLPPRTPIAMPSRPAVGPRAVPSPRPTTRIGKAPPGARAATTAKRRNADAARKVPR